MNHRMKRLSLAVRVGLTAGVVAATGLAQAQQSSNPTTSTQDQTDQNQTKTQAKTLQTVVVTGSLIRRVDLETSSPVTTIDRQNITSSGKPTLGDLMQQLPSIAGNATNPQNNSNGGGVASPLTEGGDGASRVSLRGLGTGRTLVLIDGQRMLNADLNLIPQAMVQKIDVLTEGASTIYGSDAVGGVVNILLRHDFEGAEISLNDGISSHGDGQRNGFSAIMGHTNDRFSLVGGLDYNKYDAVPDSRRDFSAHQLYLSDGAVSVAGSSSIPNGRMQLPGSFAAQYGCTPDSSNHIVVTRDSGSGTSLGDYRCRTSSDTFNYAAYDYIQVEPAAHRRLRARQLQPDRQRHGLPRCVLQPHRVGRTGCAHPGGYRRWSGHLGQCALQSIRGHFQPESDSRRSEQRLRVSDPTHRRGHAHPSLYDQYGTVDHRCARGIGPELELERHHRLRPYRAQPDRRKRAVHPGVAGGHRCRRQHFRPGQQWRGPRRGCRGCGLPEIRNHAATLGRRQRQSLLVAGRRHAAGGRRACIASRA